MKKKLTSKLPLPCTFLIVFLLGLFSNMLSAQIVLDTATVKTRTISCPSGQSFTDDNLSSGLYFDDKARRDTLILCPNSNAYQVKVTFITFDVAGGDVLYAYDGDITENPGAPRQSASGTGSSSGFGGWVQANCDPSINPTGCLSFVFDTNGDKIKGNGWQANISCESSGVSVQCPSNVSVTDNCSSLDGMVSVTIPKPTFTSCGGSSFSQVRITSSCSAIPNSTVTADGGTLGNFTIPLGSYSITATSVADDSKSCTYYVVADQPNIACNDNLNSTIGFGCTARVGVDDIIENPCYGSGTTYRLSVDLGSKGGGVKSVTIDGSSQSSINSGGLDIASENFDCGKEYTIEVTRIVSFSGCGGGNSLERSCSGKVKFVDNSAPTIAASSPTLTTCGNLTDEEVKRLLTINVSDNCAVKDTVVSVGNFPSNFCSSNLSVPITITAVDYCGNSNTKTINVKIIRPTKFYAPKDTVLNCGSGTGPEIAGYPVLDTDGDNIGDLPIIGTTCSYIPIYTDEEVTATNSKTIKIFRTWKIEDWCDNIPPITLAPQLIEVKDTGKPSINCPSGTQKGTEDNPHIVSVSSSNCTGTVNLPPPTASDDCGGEVTVAFEYATNIWDHEVYNDVTGLPIGNYYAVYFGRDATNNRSDTCKVYFNVQDSNAPQAICVDALNVSFVNNVATIHVEDIDAGSSDNCGNTNKDIRKEGGDWGQSVSLTCEDINNGGKVYLRVRDGNGGENTCWVQITGKDSTVPECNDLPDKTVACEDFHNDQFGSSTDANENKSFDDNEWQPLTGSLESAYNDAFGSPDCSDNLTCGSAIIEQEYQLVAAGCGQTQIKRRHRATDNGSNQSAWKEQLITLTFSEDFSINFPGDWEGSCGDNFPEASLNLAASGCSILAWTHEDKRFEGNNETCNFIERTYAVTNWCAYNAGDPAMTITRIEDDHGFSAGLTITNDALGTGGLFEYIQILKISDDTGPIITDVAVEECLTGENCNDQKTFKISATDCLGEEGLSYSYELLENGAVIKSGQAASFTTTVEANTYEVKWVVSDNCGNTSSLTKSYAFKDCVRPNPFCLNGLVTEIGTSGTVVIWATDIYQKSADNCTAEENLELRIFHPSIANTFTRPESGDGSDVVLALPTNITLDCAYLGTQILELYIIDEAGNWDYCTGYILVQDNLQGCDGSNISFDPNVVAMVSGGILTTNNIPLSGVELTANSTANFEKTFTTDDSGIFELDLPKGIGYIISFNKEDDPANGMTVFDIIMVSKHILGISSFDAMHQLIAADINNSGSITAFDMVQMRKIILGIDTEFADNTPWRFVPAGGFTSTNNPNSPILSETIVIPELTEALSSLDYLAIKVGDLNGSVNLGGFTQAEDRNSRPPLMINVLDKAAKRGEKVSLTLTARQLANLQGLQFGLNLTHLSLDNIEYGAIGSQHIAINRAGELKVCWDKFNGEDLTKATDQLFTLNLTASKDGYLSELLTLSSAYKEAVDNQEVVTPIALNFEKTASPINFKLYQNTPNPFTVNTKIGFELTQKGAIQLDIFNLQGALLYQVTETYESGYHEINIGKSALNGNGILLYQLTTPNGIASKKMILIK